jgi:serine/threonine protein kinase
LALAIGELHEKGFTHRDLKLENILINQKGYLRVIDYGLAKIIKKERLTTFCGTPEY